MIDFLIPFVIFALIGVIVIQAVERYFFSEQINRERHDMLKFVLSRNTREYSEITHVEKTPLQNNTGLSDEVELDQADEEVFNKYLKNS